MSVSEHDLALAVMDDDGYGCAITSAAAARPTRIRITWSETRVYRAIVPLADLENAIRTPGPASGGHPVPASLKDLKGDVFNHGDLNGLLCDLEPDCLETVEDITVESIRPAREGE